jgi:hypothetical protein
MSENRFRKNRVMLEKENDGNFNMNFYAENRKEWKFWHEKIYWLGYSLSFFCLCNHFSKGELLFWAKKHPKTKLQSMNKPCHFSGFPYNTFFLRIASRITKEYSF